MKKFFLLAFVAATPLMFGACSGEKNNADKAEPEATLAETNAGVDVATDSDEAASLASASSDDKVKVLSDDKVYRPGMKVSKLTVLDFNATWCGPCKQFAPVFHAVADKYGDKVDFVSIDTDVNPETAQAFGIQAIPTVVFLYPNGKTKSFVGTEDIMPESRFSALVQGEM